MKVGSQRWQSYVDDSAIDSNREWWPQAPTDAILSTRPPEAPALITGSLHGCFISNLDAYRLRTDFGWCLAGSLQAAPVAAMHHRFLGRPPFLPHCESFFLCLRIVTLPPFLPMHRGQIMRVRGCSRQYVSLGTGYYYPKTSPARPPAGFFLPLPPFLPHSESRSLCLDAVVCPPPDAMHRGQIIFE